ncbi:hypothetical protein M758_12G065600 [Ceratodon purpureus]|nr:hypothetical protein M758_12G065600 [Ceratodon purpureus]
MSLQNALANLQNDLLDEVNLALANLQNDLLEEVYLLVFGFALSIVLYRESCFGPYRLRSLICFLLLLFCCCSSVAALLLLLFFALFQSSPLPPNFSRYSCVL